MKRSTERFLTTHTGSLPRPDDLVRMMFAREEGVPVDGAALAARTRTAVAEIVRRQADAGVDVIDDGELSKPSYATYVKDRLAGFGGTSTPRTPRISISGHSSSDPDPPNVTSVKSRTSSPRLTVIWRTALAWFQAEISRMPAAHSSAASPRRFAKSATPARAASASSGTSPPPSVRRTRGRAMAIFWPARVAVPRWWPYRVWVRWG